MNREYAMLHVFLNLQISNVFPKKKLYWLLIVRVSLRRTLFSLIVPASNRLTNDDNGDDPTCTDENDNESLFTN